VVHTYKKRVHFRISCESLTRLDELVKVANKSTARPGTITRSDIIDQIILKNTRNKLEVIDEEIKKHAQEVNRLQQLKRDIERETEARGIPIPTITTE